MRRNGEKYIVDPLEGRKHRVRRDTSLVNGMYCSQFPDGKIAETTQLGRHDVASMFVQCRN